MKQKIYTNLKTMSRHIFSRLLYLFIGLFLAVSIIVVQAAWQPLTDVDDGDTLTEALWEEHVNNLNDLNSRTNNLQAAVNTKSRIDFSVAGNTSTFTCTPAGGNFRVGPIPAVGVTAGIYNFYKTSGRDVRARLTSVGGGTVYGTIFADDWEDSSNCADIAHGSFAIIPVDANGNFRCSTNGLVGRDANAVIEATLIAYIY